MYIISAIINGDPINNYLIDRAAVEAGVINRNGGPILLQWLEELGGINHEINPAADSSEVRVLRNSSAKSNEVD